MWSRIGITWAIIVHICMYVVYTMMERMTKTKSTMMTKWHLFVREAVDPRQVITSKAACVLLFKK